MASESQATNPQECDAGLAQQIEDLCKQWEQEALQMYNKTLDGNPQDSDLMAQLKKASVDGIELRSALGNRFARSHDGGKCAEYMEKRLNEKAEFRKQWAMKKYKELSMEKVHSKSYQQVNTKDGTYRSFVWLLREEGSDQDAFQRVKKYTWKCLAMGPPWTRWEPMWERMEYLHFEHKFTETFSSSWAMYEKELEKAEGDGNTSNEIAQEPPAKKTRVEGGEATVTETEAEKAKRLKEEKEKKQKEDKERRQQNQGRPPATPKPQTAAKIKTKYMLGTAAASNLDNKIEKEAEWKWAKESPTLCQPFRDAQAKLLAYMTENTYASDFCLLNTQELKRKYSDGDSQIGQGSMVKELDTILDDLNKEVGRLLSMQAGKNKGS